MYAASARARRAGSAAVMELMERRILWATTRFAVIGDYSAGAALREVSDVIKSWAPNVVATVGDNNYPDGARSSIDTNVGQYFHQFISPYNGNYGEGSPRGNRFWPALGDHDYQTPGAQPYLDYFQLPGNERYYTVKFENVQLFIVNSNPEEPDGVSSNSDQAQWLEEHLTGSTAKWKLVLFHHPPFSSGMHGSSSYMRWPFKSWGATAVISGHDHVYERVIRDGLPYFINGLGGANRTGFSGPPVSGSQVRYNGDYGAMRIDTSEREIVFKFITRNGARGDTYRINIATGSIGGIIFNDSDGDGVKDGSERGVGGRMVFIDADKDGLRDGTERTAVTDSSGAYVITGLAPGRYRVREIVPSGWRATGPVRQYHDVDVPLGQHVRRINFAIAQTGPFSPAGLILAGSTSLSVDEREGEDLLGRREGCSCSVI